ncbi:MAG: leucine-rich repeat protein, partial [Bacteroidales bacterium]|nr:leucine-rich repeat protein [Bacteroidales bacterium]
MLISMAAKAQDAINYIDENGKTQTQKSATKIADNTTTTTLDNQWYYVSDEITFDGAISVSGDVHLILCDGATLTAKEGIVVNRGNSLTIYGQSNGTGAGKLVATGYNGSAGIGSQMYYTSGTITINGGNIGATGSDTYGSAGIGGAVYGGCGKIFLNGGNITASSIGSYDGQSGSILISSAATIKNASSVLNAQNIISQFDYFDGKILYYVVDDENHYVSVGDGNSTAWLGDGDEVDIPATVKIGDQTYTVTKIAASAFNECEDLKKVILPSSLTYIGEEAFRNLRNWDGELAIP